MAFDPQEVSKLLAECHRRCCVCHKFCGVKMEVHHIHWKSKGGPDDIDNAIPLCFECHAEVNHYNPEHPKGRRFTKEELHEHKNQWLEICKKYPMALVSAPRDTDIGPLEGIALELEHNEEVINQFTDGTPWQDKIGCVLLNDEYKRSIGEGAILLLPEDLRKSINMAYAEVGKINTFVDMYANTRPEGNAFAEATNRLLESYRNSSKKIISAKSNLDKFLSEGKEV